MQIRFSEEKAQIEREFQETQAENVKALAAIRGEVSDRVRRLKVALYDICLLACLFASLYVYPILYDQFISRHK